ncbi:hypothetical protein HII31_03209 [Pseudocercospora fuligena]|uniref:Uncharacterized protein n=1 Tax=Pseudocercospora fuligena TaxID=685502 RepID=A0A8H6RQE4_9PEZI|nr:hypothetical protein HII31_03209 [Pseudocercospora fuligena]
MNPGYMPNMNYMPFQGGNPPMGAVFYGANPPVDDSYHEASPPADEMSHEATPPADEADHKTNSPTESILGLRQQILGKSSINVDAPFAAGYPCVEHR